MTTTTRLPPLISGDGLQEIEQEYPKLLLPASTPEQNLSYSARSMGILQMRRHHRNVKDRDLLLLSPDGSSYTWDGLLLSDLLLLCGGDGAGEGPPRRRPG